MTSESVILIADGDPIVRYRFSEADPYTYETVPDDDTLDNLQDSCDHLDYLIDPGTRAHFAEYRRSFKVYFSHDPDYGAALALVTGEYVRGQ